MHSLICKINLRSKLGKPSGSLTFNNFWMKRVAKGFPMVA